MRKLANNAKYLRVSHTHWCINIKTQRKFPSNKQSLNIFSTSISSQTCPCCTKHTLTVWTERGHTNIDHQRHIYWIFYWIFQCHWFQVKILWLEPHWKVIFTIQLFTALQCFSEHGVLILQNIFARLTFCNFTSFSRKDRNKPKIPRAIWSPGQGGPVKLDSMWQHRLTRLVRDRYMYSIRNTV